MDLRRNISRALVPALRRITHRGQYGASAPRAEILDDDAPDQTMNLVDDEVYLRNRTQVERYLPDILGRALARAWIDQTFRGRFTLDPVETLRDYDVHLPDSIDIEIETTETMRPRVVVYERGKTGRRTRLLYLQLAMMAGR